jgi:hypothetical protein
MWYNRVMKPKQVDFKAAKASDIPLNGKQLDLLALIGDAGSDGALVHGRGPTETVAALLTRCLVTPKDGSVAVVIMGRLEYRKLYVLTAKGQGMLA